MGLLKLYDEVALLKDLQKDALGIIRSCGQIEPVKKLVESYDILDLTLSIAKEFPVVVTKLPECDLGALLHLRHLTYELGVYWHPYLPRPEFPKYSDKIKKLMVVYQVPRQR
jgi:hypothetical protein